MPSLTVMTPPGGILRLARVVLVVNGTLPVPVAGAGPEGVVEDDLGPDRAANFFSSAMIALWTRVCASWVAI